MTRTNNTTAQGATKEVTTIDGYWNEDEKEVSEAAKSSRLKALRREAEIAVAGYAGKVDEAETDLANTIRASFKGQVAVTHLFDLKRAVKVAKAKHADATSDYIEFFGEKPALQ